MKHILVVATSVFLASCAAKKSSIVSTSTNAQDSTATLVETLSARIDSAASVQIEVVDTAFIPPADSASFTGALTGKPLRFTASGFDLSFEIKDSVVSIKARHQPAPMTGRKYSYRKDNATKSTTDWAKAQSVDVQSAHSSAHRETSSKAPPGNSIIGLVILALLFSGLFYFKKRA